MITQTVTSDMHAVERERALCDALIAHTIWGGIVNQVAVCNGYAKSLMYALNMVGVPTQMIVEDGLVKNMLGT